jgi:hypothetical protein
VKFIKRADEVNRAFALFSNGGGTGDVCLTSGGGRFIKQAQNQLKFPA